MTERKDYPPYLDYPRGNTAKIKVPTPIGHLEHEPTKAQISVYSKIGWLKRLMLKWCFGLRYVERKQ